MIKNKKKKHYIANENITKNTMENLVFCRTILPDLFLTSRKVHLKWYQVTKTQIFQSIELRYNHNFPMFTIFSFYTFSSPSSTFENKLTN